MIENDPEAFLLGGWESVDLISAGAQAHEMVSPFVGGKREGNAPFVPIGELMVFPFVTRLLSIIPCVLYCTYFISPLPYCFRCGFVYKEQFQFRLMRF